MKQYSSSGSVIGNRSHFKNEARLKNRKNRTLFLTVVYFALFVTLYGCNIQEDMNEIDKGKLDIIGMSVAELPGTFLRDMAIDNNHVLYYVTDEVDNEERAKLPIESSYLPIRYYLSRKVEETGQYEILYDRFVGDKVCFDKNNNMWSWNSTTIYKIEGNSYKKIIEQTYGGFNSFAVDNDNNIWVGGLQTGLYKIDSQLNISRYNAELPVNSMTSIHIDKNNNIWIALWNSGILKISNDQWVVYENVSSQSIWCLTTDKNGHLWIGTGHFNEENQSLRRFDGIQWETINPQNDKNEYVKGTVRLLQSDGQKIYVVAEHVNVFPNGGGAELISTELLTFDGAQWNKIHDNPEDRNIPILVVDHYRQAIWVATPNNGIIKIPIN